MTNKIAADVFTVNVGQFWNIVVVPAEKEFDELSRVKDSFVRDSKTLEISAHSVIDSLKRVPVEPKSPEIIEQVIATVWDADSRLLKAIDCIKHSVDRLPQSRAVILDAEQYCKKIHEEIHGLTREMADTVAQWRARTSQAAQLFSTESTKNDAEIRIVSDGIKEITQRTVADTERKIRDLEQQLKAPQESPLLSSTPQSSKPKVIAVVMAVLAAVLAAVAGYMFNLKPSVFLGVAAILSPLTYWGTARRFGGGKLQPGIPGMQQEQTFDPVEFKRRSRQLAEEAAQKTRVKVSAMQAEIKRIEVAKSELVERRKRAEQEASQSAKAALMNIAEGKNRQLVKNAQVVSEAARGLSDWASKPIEKLMKGQVADLTKKVETFKEQVKDIENTLVSDGTKNGVGATKLSLGKLERPFPPSVANILGVRTIQIPYIFDLEDSGLAVINDFSAPAFGNSVKRPSLLNSFVLRMLNNSGTSGIVLHLIDPTQFGAQFEDILQVGGANLILLGGGVVSQRRETEERLTQISKVIEERIRVMAASNAASYSDYIQKNTSAQFPVYVLAIASFPDGFSETALGDLQRIALIGPRCGILILIEGKNRFTQQNPPRFDLGLLLSSFSIMSCKGEACILPDAVWDDWSFLNVPMNEDGKRRLIEKYRLLPENIAPELKNSVLPKSDTFQKVFLPELERQGYWKSDAIHGIKLPLGVGKDGSLLYFNLNNLTPHAILTGTSGSGKSTLLNSMINYVALAYHPDELGLFLADFKGSEFGIYAGTRQIRLVTETAASTAAGTADFRGGLPHARAIASTRRAEFGDVLLQEIKSELDRRVRLFKEAEKTGNGKVSEYHIYRKVTGRKLPRLVFILDEFQILFTDFETKSSRANALAAMAQQARSFGVHIFLATQSVAPVSSSIGTFLGLIANRIVLPSHPSDLTYVLSGEAKEIAKHECRERGQGLFDKRMGEGHRDEIFLFSAPYFPDEDQTPALKIIEQLFPEANTYFENQYITADDPPSITECKLFGALQATPIPVALLGVPYALEHAVSASFESKRKRNLVCAISDRDQKINLMVSIFQSLARSAENPLIVLFCDNAIKDRCIKVLKALLLDTLQVEYCLFDEAGFERLASLGEKISHDGDKTISSQKQFVIAFDPTDRQIVAGKLADGLRMLASYGPQANCHVILFLKKHGDFEKLLEQENYEVRVCDKASETALKGFTNLERIPKFEKDNKELLFVDHSRADTKVFRAFNTEVGE